MGRLLLIFTLLSLFLLQAIEKEHMTYLMQSKEVGGALDLYQNYKQEIGRHDFEVLVQMCTILLQQGIRSPDLNTQLSSLYGISIAHIHSSLDLLEQGIRSQNIETQLASIQMLAEQYDDHADELLIKAMASPFLMVRMESAYHLAQRKHRKITGQLETLMAKIPPELEFYFPQFFAMIGTHDAIEVLKELLHSPYSLTRVESLLNIAKFGRDDLLPYIRAHATHAHIDEQEAAVTALGVLKDSSSISKIKSLTLSSSSSVRLAALRSLYLLGDTTAFPFIIEMAKHENLYAISLLGELSGGEPILTDLLSSNNIHVRFNATLSLLLQRDARSLKTLFEFLITDSKDLGFQPTSSLGHSLMAWKVIPSLHHQTQLMFDLTAVSLQLKEQMLVLALELEESDFLKVATRLFQAEELQLIPLLVQLLENHGSPGAIALLKTFAESARAPLIRIYCHLALFRLKEEGPYEKKIEQWMMHSQKLEMMKFRPPIPWNIKNVLSVYELTPAESTRLLLECYEAFSRQHTEQAIDLILHALRNGHPKNRFALAGLLIHTLQ